jgi:uridylate kinase
MTPPETPKARFGRVMLKISGEALMGDQGYGLHPPTVERIAQEVKNVHDMGVEICMVIGGGKGWSAPPPITWGCWPP